MSRLAVVTGGTGFIGWNLCERLLGDGWRVRAAVRATSRNPLPAGVERVDMNLEAEAMAPVLSGAGVVFHLAGLTRARSYERFVQVNAEAARQVALAARQAETFMVLVSSQAAAGPAVAEHPAREDQVPRPVSLYGRSKLAGEVAVAAVEGLRFATVRPPGVYGPRDTDFLPLFQIGRRGVFPMLGSPRAAYTLVHVDDAVQALVQVAEAGVDERPSVQEETFFIGHPQVVRGADFAAALSATLERRVRPLRVPRPVLWSIAEIGELVGNLGRPALMNRDRYRELTAPGYVCDVSKIERAVGHRARYDLQQGFAATAAWYRAQGLL